MINFILWVMVGGIAGGLANLIMRTDGHRGMFLNILAGIEGAAVAGLVLSPLFGVNPLSHTTSAPALLLALVGAFLLLTVVNLFRRRVVASNARVVYMFGTKEK